MESYSPEQSQNKNKINKLTNVVLNSNKKLNNAKIEIEKLNEINKHILNIIYDSNKELYSEVSEKILKITKTRKESENNLCKILF